MRPHRHPSVMWTLQVGGWLAFATAMSLGRLGEYPPRTIAAIEWPFAALGFLTTLALAPLYGRVQATSVPLPRIVAVSVAGSYAGSLVWTATYHLYLRNVAAPLLAAWTGKRSKVVYSGPLLDNTVYNALALLAWSVLFFGIQYYQALHQERERALRAEALAHQAQLQMLAYQLNPHFLFNALNSLRALIDEDRGRARRMVTELAGFLRYALEERPLQVARLAEELEAVQGYLRVEMVRFEERLDVRVEVAPEAARCCVPAFLLHPLVENALKHGTPARPGDPLRVRVRAAVREGRLTLEVENTGTLAPRPVAGVPLPEEGRLLGKGVGLRNVRARLQQLFPGRHRVEVGEEAGWVRVRVELPAAATEAEVLGGNEEERWAYATR